MPDTRAGIGTSRRPRTPGFIYGGLSLTLLMILGVVALTATQPPPPTIAEFAPQAVEQITESPSEQSSRFGTGGDGDCSPSLPNCEGQGSGVVGTSPPSPAPPIDVPRVRTCVGDPPRQIEDPQSPPCVPYWSGDNGGVTSKGVTAVQLNVAVPNWHDTIHPPLQAFFNKRFEFYGRKLNLVDIGAPEPGADPERQKADAEEADGRHGAFASLDYSADGGFHYYRELASRRIMASAVQAHSTEAYLARHGPYLWQYQMGVDRMAQNVGEWICEGLAGSRAEFAGTSDVTDLSTRIRRFGLVFSSVSEDRPFDPEPALKELSGCGVRPEVADFGVDLFDTERATQVILQMKSAEVTSVICLCHAVGTGTLARLATTQQYFPEWALATYLLQDYNWTLRTFVPAEHLSRTFGLTFQPRQNPVDRSPSRWAVKEGDPDWQGAGGASCGSEWASKTSPACPLWVDAQYRSLLLLASGIQMAGPNLTPISFERGLQRAAFPNPQHPIMSGAVGFAGGSHTMTIDGAQWWWDPSGRSPYPDEGRGTICYVQGGRRHVRGQWFQAEGRLFQPPCDSGA